MLQIKNIYFSIDNPYTKISYREFYILYSLILTI